MQETEKRNYNMMIADERMAFNRARLRKLLGAMNSELARAEFRAGEWHDDACEVTGSEEQETRADECVRAVIAAQVAVKAALKAAGG